MTEDFLRWFARWVDPNIGRVEQGVQCAAAWAAWRARATLHPLERLKQVTAERDSLAREAQRQAGKIERLRERVFELEADPKSGDVIPLAEPRCGDLRRSAERCITAWTVVRGGVWDPNGLMDEHMAALRKALGPNVRIQPRR